MLRFITGLFALSMIVAAPRLSGEVEPHELTALNESYQRARERVLEPLKATYLSELRSLVEKLTKQGRLDDALKVKNLLEGLVEEDKKEEEPEDDKKPSKGVSKLELAAAADLIGEWTINHKDDDVISFDEKKQATYNREEGRWAMSRSVSVVLPDGTRFTFLLNEKDEILAQRHPPGEKMGTPVILSKKEFQAE